MYSQYPFYQIENFLYCSLYWHWIISKRIKSEEEKNIHSNSWTEDTITLKFGGNLITIFGNIEIWRHCITISTIRWLDYHSSSSQQAQLLVEYLTIGFLFYIYQNKNTPSKDTKYASFAWMRFNTPGENSFIPLDINSVGTSKQNNDKVLYIDTTLNAKKWAIIIFGFGQILWILWQKKALFSQIAPKSRDVGSCCA